MGAGVMRKLAGKSGTVVPKKGKWRVAYMGFARDGWTDAAHQLAADMQVWTTPDGANWQPVALRLLDLAQIDTDLHRWLLDR